MHFESRPLTALGLAFGLWAAAAPALAQAPAEAPVDDQDVADILDALTHDAPAPQAAPIRPQGAQSMNPDLSFILDGSLAGFSRTPDQRGGHDPSKNGFNLQQLELSVRSVVDPFWRFDGNLVFSQYGVEVEEAYATTTALPHDLQLRAGQFLTRFGRLNPTHPHAWEFVDQPLVLGKFFGGEGNRGLGTELSWLSPLPWYLEVVGSATEAGGASTARSFFGGQDLGVQGPLDLQYTGAIKQFFPLSDAWSLSWGLSGATGPNSSGRSNRSDIYGTDLYLKYRPATSGDPTVIGLTCEALARRRQVPGAVLGDMGGYASAFWKFDPSWAVAARYESVTGTANDPLDPEWTGGRQRASANLTYWPSEFTRIRLQGSADVRRWVSEPTYAAMLAFETVIGAHGAHAF
ncbi:zinc-regulated TonB-dependent outer membrane receptor [bacterium]|nr:zinc-regulated TonB-dependent outer membrane receptor [bacterium]